MKIKQLRKRLLKKIDGTAEYGCFSHNCEFAKWLGPSESDECRCQANIVRRLRTLADEIEEEGLQP